MPIPRFHLDTTALLVVDMQPRLLQAMQEPERLLAQVGKLIDGANVLGIPVLATEHYPKGLGHTVDALLPRLAGALCVEEKLKFSACIEPVRHILAERNLHQVIVCGIEAHICVLQTCLDLAQAGYVTAVAVDATSSRQSADRETAVLRLTQAGIIPTTVESVLYELTHEAGTDHFKALLPIIR